MADVLRCTRLSTDRGHRLLVAGEIDLATAPTLATHLAECPDGNVVIDFSRVEFMDSTGLNVLVNAHKQLEMRGDHLAIVGVQQHVRRVFQVTGLDEYLELESPMRVPS